ncbi:repeated sequence with similarity to MUC1 [Scheffersomyces stipitis CBS 6054]|uniref:Repeated sequence with similarity to MUC1 n=1 Tax=Scheffersomyces stipitis (strain ATCC 58785 / CBS 6054 / NBRC 10063 / NRRL Y-11545) TaxID=322104 RepID=A3LZX6_PICST|nr:repeated sequence with similarity to MUC1 [Scheffersomyces stipitis CBS 6054]ABN68419.2 repeated sequence with similarity to MUC1 [Scheffersomyces stipitis CBS 6054]
MSELRPINQPEGPLGVFSGESSSNQALNEPKPPDIDRNPHDHVAPHDSMDLDGESTDADENGNLEPSFVTAVSSTSEEPAQLRDNPTDESVIQNQTPLSPTMESFETSVSEIFQSHVLDEVHDQEMAANDDNEMDHISLNSTTSLSNLPEQEDSLLVHQLKENTKTQKNSESLQYLNKNQKNSENTKLPEKNTQDLEAEEYPLLGTSKSSSKKRIHPSNPNY